MWEEMERIPETSITTQTPVNSLSDKQKMAAMKTERNTRLGLQ